jgi:hypothetical protein
MEHNSASQEISDQLYPDIESDVRNVYERTIIVRFSVADVDKAVAWARANPSIQDEITAYGKSLGQLGHRMLTADGDLVVIDEWPTAEAFTTFFANAPRMADFLAGAGIQGEPAISVLDSVDGIPGTF